jgi:hypothetical protein
VADGGRPGVAVTPLFLDPRENVRMERWDPGVVVPLDTDGGAELFVLEGGFEEGGDHLRRWSWLRLPIGAQAVATAGPAGARVWIKSGHLRFVSLPSA